MKRIAIQDGIKVLTLCLSYLLFEMGPSFGSPPIEAPAPNQAQLLMDQEKWTEALALLRVETETNPRLDSILLLSRALVNLHRREEAATTLLSFYSVKRPEAERKVIEERVRVLSRFFYRQEMLQKFHHALRSMERAEWQLAAEGLTEILSVEGSHVEVLVRLAQCEIQMGRYQEALGKLEVARSANPFEPQITLWVARAKYLNPETRLQGEVELESFLKSNEAGSSRLQALYWLLEERSLLSAHFKRRKKWLESGAALKQRVRHRPVSKERFLYSDSQVLLFDFHIWKHEQLRSGAALTQWIKRGGKLSKSIDLIRARTLKEPSFASVILGQDFALDLSPNWEDVQTHIRLLLAPLIVPWRSQTKYGQ